MVDIAAVAAVILLLRRLEEDRRDSRSIAVLSLDETLLDDVVSLLGPSQAFC